MYAINHAATALVVKKRYPSVPLLPLLLAVQFVEVLWVVLNFLDIEHTTLVGGVTRLSDMPWSHSVAMMAAYAVVAWLILAFGFRRKVLGAAIGIAIASHLVLDLATHLPDLQLAPGIDIRMGSGLYSLPLLAFILESAYGLACWRIFGGNWRLLAGIVINNLINLPLFFAAGSPPDPNGPSAPTNLLAVSVIALEIVITWFVVWYFARTSRPASAARLVSTMQPGAGGSWHCELACLGAALASQLSTRAASPHSAGSHSGLGRTQLDTSRVRASGLRALPVNSRHGRPAYADISSAARPPGRAATGDRRATARTCGSHN